jgi:hypothetical protein
MEAAPICRKCHGDGIYRGAYGVGICSACCGRGVIVAHDWDVQEITYSAARQVLADYVTSLHGRTDLARTEYRRLFKRLVEGQQIAVADKKVLRRDKEKGMFVWSA